MPRLEASSASLRLASSADPPLRAEHVTVRVALASVVDDVSFSLSPGEIVGLFGPTGAGKSTLFRALAGDQAMDGGRVFLGRSEVTAAPLFQRARQGLGYVPQTPSVLFDLTVRENMKAFAHFSGKPPDADLLADLGLTERLDVRAGTLSGGERRKLEIARALSGRPSVLLCDEPFAALDPNGKKSVGARLSKLAREGAAVLLADHDVREALRLCHRATLLLGGRLVCEGSPAEFAEDPLVRAHYAVLEDPSG